MWTFGSVLFIVSDFCLTEVQFTTNTSKVEHSDAPATSNACDMSDMQRNEVNELNQVTEHCWLKKTNVLVCNQARLPVSGQVNYKIPSPCKIKEDILLKLSPVFEFKMCGTLLNLDENERTWSPKTTRTTLKSLLVRDWATQHPCAPTLFIWVFFSSI